MSTHNTIINEKRKSSEIIPITIKSAAMRFFFLLGAQEQVRNSCSKQAISVQAIEVLLYVTFCFPP